MTQTAALTQEERAEIRALCERATPGPWVVGEHASQVVAPCPCCGPIATCDMYGPESGDREYDARMHYNSEFIAAARTLVPRLLDALEAAERERDVRDRAAQDLCRIYFEIAEEAIGGDEVRRQRDERIGRLLADRSADAA
jgi:hypothetical protein